MLCYRLGTVNDFHWGFKPVLSYSKPHTFSTSLGEEKERKNAFNLSIAVIAISDFRTENGDVNSKMKTFSLIY